MRLKEARFYKGITQAALAARSKISAPTLSLFEQGLRTPKPEQLDKIAAVLGVDPASLTFDEAKQKPKVAADFPALVVRFDPDTVRPIATFVIGSTKEIKKVLQGYAERFFDWKS